MERNLREDLSWNKRNLGDLEYKSGSPRSFHEAGGMPKGVGAPPPSWAPLSSTDLVLSPIYSLIP